MMTLASLKERIQPRVAWGDAALEVRGVHYDSRRIEPGWAFFALRGEHVDGHAFIDQAIANGAALVVMQEQRELPAGVAGMVVENGRRALAAAASLAYGDPSSEIPVVGVTGTNGKTTVTYLVEALLRESGRYPAVLGTIDYRFGEERLPSLHTTPEAPELLGTLADSAPAAVTPW